MSPGTKSPSSSAASSPGCSKQRAMLSLRSPCHPAFHEAAENPSRFSGVIFQTQQALVRLLSCLPGCPGWPRAPAAGSLGQFPAAGNWVRLGVPTRALAFCPDFRVIKLLCFKLFRLQTLKSLLQMKHALVVQPGLHGYRR